MELFVFHKYYIVYIENCLFKICEFKFMNLNL